MEAVRQYQKPRTKRDLRAFLGLIGYYRRFVPQFSTHSAKLTDATGKNHPEVLEWTDDMEREFTHLRESLTHNTSQHTFDPQKHTILHTDASDRGLGGVLLQQDNQGEEKPIAYFSRKLLPRQTNYTVTRKECLAVVEAVKHFEPYLLGAPFTLVTDHKALLALPRTTSGGARVTRWALTLQPFDFQIIHKPGKKHADADGLSREGSGTLAPEALSKEEPKNHGMDLGWRGVWGCEAQAQGQDLWHLLCQRGLARA